MAGSSSKYLKYMKFAQRHARQAGDILLKHFGKLKFEHEKGPKNPVTNVDLEAQRYYTREISKAFPGHGFLGEESTSLGDLVSGREYTWIVDPLDGTINYSAGIPLFCTSIAVARNGKSVAGAIYNPILNEMFTAYKGGGAFLNGRHIKPSRQELEKSVVAISLSSNAKKNALELEVIRRLNPYVRRFRAIGSIAYEEINVAYGRIAASIHTTTTPWDAAASNLIAEEAGCTVTDFEGRPWKLDNPNVVISNNSKTHKLILSIIKAVK